MKKLLAVCLTLAVIAAWGFFTVTVVQKVNSLNVVLGEETATRIAVQENLRAAEEEINVALQNYDDLEEQFREATRKSMEVESGLTESLNASRAEVQTLKVDLIEAKKQLAVFEQRAIQEYQRGFDEGYRKVDRRNPTLDELKTFLTQDKTDQKIWTTAYNCGDFSAELDANAEVAGLRAGFAWIIRGWMPNGKWGHFMNAFELASGEIVFVEPQNDLIYELEVGGSYNGESIKQILIAW